MDRETEAVLLLTSRALRFATDHPYAATGLLGAAVGSAITYRVLMFTQRAPSVSDIFTPKAYSIALPPEDLRHLLNDPQAELRWETPEVTVTIIVNQPEPMKALPVVDYETE